MDMQDVKIDMYVAYTPFKDCDETFIQYGVVTSFNSKYVFVRYGKDLHSKPTLPKDLKISVDIRITLDYN